MSARRKLRLSQNSYGRLHYMMERLGRLRLSRQVRLLGLRCTIQLRLFTHSIIGGSAALPRTVLHGARTYNYLCFGERRWLRNIYIPDCFDYAILNTTQAYCAYTAGLMNK